jgi:hypothetical protein
MFYGTDFMGILSGENGDTLKFEPAENLSKNCKTYLGYVDFFRTSEGLAVWWDERVMPAERIARTSQMALSGHPEWADWNRFDVFLAAHGACFYDLVWVSETKDSSWFADNHPWCLANKIMSGEEED